jgi:hypothetical protein
MKSAILIVVASTALLFSCSKKEDNSSQCTKKTTANVKAVNFFDFNPSSPYYNKVVANFSFTQSSNTYTGSASCPLMDCSVDLTIQNTTSSTISFDYNVVFTLNAAAWNFQNVATIAPGATVTVGTVSSSCASIALGAIALQSTGVSYR